MAVGPSMTAYTCAHSYRLRAMSGLILWIMLAAPEAKRLPLGEGLRHQRPRGNSQSLPQRGRIRQQQRTRRNSQSLPRSDVYDLDDAKKQFVNLRRQTSEERLKGKYLVRKSQRSPKFMAEGEHVKPVEHKKTLYWTCSLRTQQKFPPQVTGTYGRGATYAMTAWHQCTCCTDCDFKFFAWAGRNDYAEFDKYYDLQNGKGECDQTCPHTCMDWCEKHHEDKYDFCEFHNGFWGDYTPKKQNGNVGS